MLRNIHWLLLRNLISMRKLHRAVFPLNANICVNLSVCLGIVEIEVNKCYTFDKKIHFRRYTEICVKFCIFSLQV